MTGRHAREILVQGTIGLSRASEGNEAGEVISLSGRVLVTGGTGVVGRRLVEELDRLGHDVRVLVRRQPAGGFFPARVRLVQGDLADEKSLIAATKDVGVVHHLATKPSVPNPTPADREEFRKINVVGTRALLEAAGRSRVSRFVFFSSISVYGPTARGEISDESSPLRPDSLYAETKVAAEDAVRACGVPTVILRLAAVYGPGMKGNYPRLVEALRGHRFALVGDGSNRRTLVYVRDAVRAAVLAAEHPAAPGETFNVTDGSVHTLREILDAICQALGRGPVRLMLPAGPTLSAARFVEAASSILGRQLPVADAVEKLVEEVAVRGEKARARLGFLAETNLPTGWKQAVAAPR